MENFGKIIFPTDAARFLTKNRNESYFIFMEIRFRRFPRIIWSFVVDPIKSC